MLLCDWRAVLGSVSIQYLCLCLTQVFSYVMLFIIGCYVIIGIYVSCIFPGICICFHIAYKALHNFTPILHSSFWNHCFKPSLRTCCPGLMGDSVIPWVLITGRIWLPITVAIIWPCALVSSCGVIGWTCREGVPPPDWLEGPTEFGIRGIVPMIYKNSKEREIKSRLNNSHSNQQYIIYSALLE